MFQVIGMLLVGLVIGILARWLYPGSVPLGFWMTIVLGIVGALVGGFLTRLVSAPRPGQLFHQAGLIVSVIGALLVLAVSRYFGVW